MSFSGSWMCSASRNRRRQALSGLLGPLRSIQRPSFTVSFHPMAKCYLQVLTMALPKSGRSTTRILLLEMKNSSKRSNTRTTSRRATNYWALGITRETSRLSPNTKKSNILGSATVLSGRFSVGTSSVPSVGSSMMRKTTQSSRCGIHSAIKSFKISLKETTSSF